MWQTAHGATHMTVEYLSLLQKEIRLETAHTDLSTTTRYLRGVSSGLGPAARLPQLRRRE